MASESAVIRRMDSELTCAATPDKMDSTSPTACLPCRQRHLKCDGRRPCTRCLDSESNCIFIPSRRGQRAHARRPHPHTATTQAISPSPAMQRMQCGVGMLSRIMPCNKASEGGYTPPDLHALQAFGRPNSRASSAEPQNLSNRSRLVDFERCIGSYYCNFHASHPLVLPQMKLRPLIKDRAIQPLLAVMQWVGAIYIAPEASQTRLLDAARLAVEDAEQTSANGFTVQAMAVMLIALDGAGYMEEAIALLERTKRLLLSLGMNHDRFSREAGAGSKVLEESWRRTWWELYVVDGMFAGAHRLTPFTLFKVPTDVGLPCEEDDYTADRIPEPATLESLNDRDLAAGDLEFSSFAYRILSAQNLGKIMSNFAEAELDADVHLQLEILLTNWRHTLPAWKHDSLHRDGRGVDEMMFQAHMMNHTTSILLHQSHALLDVYPARTINACTPQEQPAGGGDDDEAAEGAAARMLVNVHTQHVMYSANELCKMITYRTPLTRHAHFFICAIVLASIVQLSAWSMQPCRPGGCGAGEEVDEEENARREQVRLCIGALQKMAAVWRTATRALGQIKEVAGQIHALRKQSRQMEQFLVNVTDEDMMNIFTADISALNELETTI